MKTVYVFLADGFEEIEAVTPIDTLRRAGVTVKTVGVTGSPVIGAHQIPVIPDIAGDDFELPDDAAMVILPGGGVGTDHLAASPMVANVLKKASARGIEIAAICAAPTVLHSAGLLKGKRSAAYPSVRSTLTEAVVSDAAYEVDGQITTGRSAGAALAFSHALMIKMAGRKTADEVLASLYPGE